MTESAKKARKEYYRKYRQDNKERIKKHQAKYWENKAKEEDKEKAIS